MLPKMARQLLLLIFLSFSNFVYPLLEDKDMCKRIFFGFVVGAIANVCGDNFIRSNLWGVTVNQLASYLVYTLPHYESSERQKRKLTFFMDHEQRQQVFYDFDLKERNYKIRSYGANFLGYLLGGAVGKKIKPYLEDKVSTSVK